MKAILEFNLPEDDAEFYYATKATDMVNALWEIQQELRKLWKYEELNEDEWQMVERIRDSFYEIIQQNNVNLNK